MNDTNFENNTEINSVHSEAKAQGHGGLKAMAIFFAITTLALGSALAYVYTSKNKDTKKLNEELVESKEKVKSANESIARYEEATQTKITDVKQDNVTVKEIVKPMAVNAGMNVLKDALKKHSYKALNSKDEAGHTIIDTWTEPVIEELFTTSDGKYMIAQISPLYVNRYKDNYGNDAYDHGYAGYRAYWYRDLASGAWKLGEEGQMARFCDELPEEYKTVMRSANADFRKNGYGSEMKCIDRSKNNDLVAL